jgi:cyclophilin family peptidyl-prolyl cis-trans isomerase
MFLAFSHCRLIVTIVMIAAAAACQPQVTMRADGQAGSPFPQESVPGPESDTFWDLQTSMGPITIRLFTDVAPRHSANIVELAGQGYYDGLYFHRVVPDLVAQGGGTAPSGRGGPGPARSILQERDPGLSHDRAGIVSMVALDDESHGSQFFITLVPAPWLDELNTIIGEVVSGMETVRAMEEVGSWTGNPDIPIRIERSSIRIEPTAGKKLQQVVSDLVRQGVTEPGAEGWRARIPEPPAVALVPGKAYDWYLETALGAIRVRLASEAAPAHTVNLMYLSAFGYFDGLYFNRVIPGFIAQGGGTDPDGPGAQGAAYTVPGERTADLRHDRPGRVSMVLADGEDSTAGQFFITFDSTPWLDESNTIVGWVNGGFGALTAIEALGSESGTAAQPVPIIRAWTEEGTWRKLPEDAALKELRAYIQNQVKAGAIDTSREGWRRELPPYPGLPFAEERSYLWHLETNLGPMTFQFLPVVTPRHVASFMYLAELGYFDGLDFHRVISGFMAQSGLPDGGGPGYSLPTVTSDLVRHDRSGVLSMANTGQPNSEYSGFFITFAPTPWLDGKHTIFGAIVAGLNTVREIENRGSLDGQPSEAIIIQRTWITVE